MLTRPIIGQNRARLFLSTHYQFDWDNALMQPGRTEGKLTTNFFSPALASINFSVDGIDQAPLGGCCLRSRWNMSRPTLCVSV